MTELFIDAMLLIAFLVILVRSAIFAIESIVKFSKITGMSELAAGFVIVAVATSMPEISVAIFSMQTENVGITLGDIFGSNITNIAMISSLFLLVSPIKKIEKKPKEIKIWFEIPKNLTKFVVQKGSIAIDGISLTVVDVQKNLASVCLIPHTVDVTNFHSRKIGDKVNIETDILGKYILKQE